MITQFKIFESEKQFREVDLQLLWDDITHNYYSKLFDKPTHLDAYFTSVLKKLLIGKYLEFNRTVNRFDDEILYNTSGEVVDVIFINDTYNYLIKHIQVSLKDESYARQLGDISNNFNFNRKPLIVKIYDSEELEIEKKIEFLKDINKYNL